MKKPHFSFSKSAGIFLGLIIIHALIRGMIWNCFEIYKILNHTLIDSIAYSFYMTIISLPAILFWFLVYMGIQRIIINTKPEVFKLPLFVLISVILFLLMAIVLDDRELRYWLKIGQIPFKEITGVHLGSGYSFTLHLIISVIFPIWQFNSRSNQHDQKSSQ